MTPGNGAAARDRIQRELGPSERLLWVGQPRPGIAFNRADVFLVPFSLMWGGFALFWEYEAIRSDAPFFMRLWGIPFVAVGLYLIAGRFLADSRRRAATVYAITNERVVLVSGVFQRTVKSWTLRTLPEVSLSEQADGSGTIVLGASTPFNAMRGFSVWPGMPAQPALEMIPDARTVYDILRRAQHGAFTH